MNPSIMDCWPCHNCMLSWDQPRDHGDNAFPSESSLDQLGWYLHYTHLHTIVLNNNCWNMQMLNAIVPLLLRKDCEEPRSLRGKLPTDETIPSTLANIASSSARLSNGELQVIGVRRLRISASLTVNACFSSALLKCTSKCSSLVFQL